MSSVYVSALKRGWIVTAGMEWSAPSEEAYTPYACCVIILLSFQEEAKAPSYPPSPQVGKL